MEKFIINIGRQLGSGGRAIGRLLSDQLGIAYFDREILTLAAQESGFTQEIFEQNDEHKGFFRSLAGGIMPSIGTGGNYYENRLSEESLFRLQSDAIRKAAERESCIFIGRCADYVLRDVPRCVNVFVCADPEDRIRRIMETQNADRRAAQRIMQQGDSRRADFYNFYSGGSWGHSATYDLCINSSVLGIERTAEVIRRFALCKLEGESLAAR